MKVPPTPTVKVPGYRLVRVLGGGGQGTCYLAIDKRTRQQVALKIVAWEGVTEVATDQFARLKREAGYGEALRIDGMATVLDMGELPISSAHHHGAGYLVSELIGDGTTLRHRLEWDPPPSLADIMACGSSLFATLDSMWSKGFYHRDIKPQNIAFRSQESWEPVLIDLGISRSSDATTLTQTGAMLGSPFYSPPEWIAQKPGEDPDWRAWDIYMAARTIAIAILVALGTPLHEAEVLEPYLLKQRLRRRTPALARRLAPTLSRRPQSRVGADASGVPHVEYDFGTLLMIDALEDTEEWVRSRRWKALDIPKLIEAASAIPTRWKEGKDSDSRYVAWLNWGGSPKWAGDYLPSVSFTEDGASLWVHQRYLAFLLTHCISARTHAEGWLVRHPHAARWFPWLSKRDQLDLRRKARRSFTTDPTVTLTASKDVPALSAAVTNIAMILRASELEGKNIQWAQVQEDCVRRPRQVARFDSVAHSGPIGAIRWREELTSGRVATLAPLLELWSVLLEPVESGLVEFQRGRTLVLLAKRKNADTET